MALSCPSPLLLLLLLSEKLQTASPSHLHLHLLLLRLLFGLLLLLQPLERPLVVAAVLVSLAVRIRRRRNRNNAAAPSRLQSPELRGMFRTQFFSTNFVTNTMYVPLFQIGRGRRRLAYDVAQEQVRRRDWLRLSRRRRRMGPAVRVGIARVGGCRQVREGVERRRVDGTFAVSGTSSPLSLVAVVMVVVVMVVPSEAAVEAVVAGGGSAARQLRKEDRRI